jgi:hypothetical protein
MIAPVIIEPNSAPSSTLRSNSSPLGGNSAVSKAADGGAVSQMVAGLVASVPEGLPKTDNPMLY